MQQVLSQVRKTHERITTLARDPALIINIGSHAYNSDKDELTVRAHRDNDYCSFTIPNYIERTENGQLDTDFYRSCSFHIDHLFEVQG